MENIQKQIIDIIQKSQSILLMPSAPADGDSLGSSLALYLVLKKLGKNVTVVSPEPVPEAYQFLPTTNVISEEVTGTNDFIVTLDCEKAKLNTIQTKIENNKVNIIITAKQGQFSEDQVSFHHGPSKYDLIITVDTGDVSQLGKFYEDNTELFTKIPVINIDHHASNTGFGKINHVDIMASATTEMVFPIIEELEKVSGQQLMDEDVATLLLAGIITDTGSFQNANTTPKSFAVSAQLIRHGARQQEIIQHVFKTKRLSTLRLWGRILSNIKVDQKHKMVWTVISRKDFDDTQSKDEESGNIIDELMTNAPDTEVVLILKEKADGGIVSGSLRTTTASVDASAIAGLFGGGGHVQAAGFKLKNTGLAQVEQMVIEKIKAYQTARLHLIENEEEEETKNHELEDQFKAAISKHIDQMGKIEAPEMKTEQQPKEEPTSKSTTQAKKVQTETSKPETEKGDIIVRKKKSEDTFNLDDGTVYKFED